MDNTYYDAVITGKCCDCEREQLICKEDGECLKIKEKLEENNEEDAV